MTTHETIITDWITVSNAHDTAAYLNFFTEDAKLNDPSVGEVFERADGGVQRYFETYVVGYKTQTRVVSITTEGDHEHVVVDFTGTFPGGKVGGVFDIRFDGARIAFIEADLI